MRPMGVALRVVVGLGVLLAPIGSSPYLYRRLADLATGSFPGPWGWLQIAFHGGVPLVLLGWAVRGARTGRRAHD